MWDFREFTEFIKDSAKYIIVIAAVFFIYLFIFSFQGIAGNSMSPYLKDNDIVVVNKLKPNIFELKRFDVVSLKSPDGKIYVKRIIGLPGEEIHYLKNTLYIDGEATSEPHLNSDVTTNSFFLVDVCKENECPDNKIPEGYYLVLGDNRKESLDSRNSELGLVPEKNIIGQIIFRLYPFNSIGKR